MRKRQLLFAALLLVARPAFADSIVQYNGDTFCKGTNSKSSLTPGVDIPADATWAPFSMQNNDTNPSNYRVLNGVCVYIPTPANNSNLINGTAGQFYWAQEVRASGVKEIVAAFNGYTQASTTMTFPVAFVVKPSVVSATVTGVSGVTITNTGITFSASNVSGTVVIKGI